MTSPFSDELISAYLDGELTAEEQARVEKQLRDDAELRRMCDELRVLRFTLQSMPVAEPAHDLANRVLRQAERRMLTGDEGAARTTTPGTAARPHGPAGNSMLRHWRAVTAAVTSLAALLLLALWLPSRLPLGRNVATSQPVPTDAPAKTMDADRQESFRRTEMLREGIDDRVHYLPAAPEGAAEAGGNATPRPHAADDKDGSYFSDAARGGEMKWKADRDEAGGVTSNMDGAPAKSVAAPRQETAASSNGTSFGMSGSLPGPQVKSRMAVQPEASRPGPALQEQDMAVPMAAGTAANPAAPGSRPQPNATTTETRPLADNEPSSDAGQLPQGMQESEQSLADPAALANLQQESRQALTQQLISEFDKNQLLLVQVSLPARAPGDSSASLGESTLGAIRLDQKAVQGLTPQLPQLYLYGVPQESQESMETLGKQLAHPLQEVILVEGSPEQIHTSLTNLVAQPEVQVVATNASREQLRSLDVAMDDLARYRGVFPGSGAPMGGSGAAMGPVYGGGIGHGGMGGAMGIGMGGYGGAAPSGMMPGAGGAGGGSLNQAGQGGYPGMGAGDSSSMPGQAPQDAPRSGGAKPGRDAVSTADGVAAGSVAAEQSRKDSLGLEGLEKEQPKMADLIKPAQQKEAKAERELGDALQRLKAAESTGDKPSSPTAGRPSDAVKSARTTGEALGRRSKAGLDSARSEETQSGETVATDQPPAVRTIVTYLFRLQPVAASPAPAEPAKQE